MPSEELATWDTTSVDETRELGRWIGERLRIGDVVLLHGDLGAGKTTLAQGIAAALSVREYVQSPTFTLINEHAIVTSNGESARLYHLDLYRLDGQDDLDSIGFEQYAEPEDGIAVIEWPERASSALPPRYLLVQLAASGPDRRSIRLFGHPPGSWARFGLR